MRVFKGTLLIVALLVMVGCSGIQVVQKPNKGDRLAILMFEDCKENQDCNGSGKKVSDFYSQVLGAPVVMFESDAKSYDILLAGQIMNYNEAVPMAFNANIVAVDLKLKRISDGQELITQKKVKTGSNLFSSTKGLSEELAEDLKSAMN
jgi:hypothetical protein